MLLECSVLLHSFSAGFLNPASAFLYSFRALHIKRCALHFFQVPASFPAASDSVCALAAAGFPFPVQALRALKLLLLKFPGLLPGRLLLFYSFPRSLQALLTYLS